MADPLYLNLWFPSFQPQEMLPRALLVMRQFPFSTQQPGISYLALHPISWEEPTILERRFRPARRSTASKARCTLASLRLVHAGAREVALAS